MPNSGADWGSLNEIEKKRMANLPALLHYGVNTDEAVLMRKNCIPRSIAKESENFTMLLLVVIFLEVVQAKYAIG